jgi:hypothetical protein
MGKNECLLLSSLFALYIRLYVRLKEISHARHSFYLPSLPPSSFTSLGSSFNAHSDHGSHAHKHTHAHAARQVASLAGSSVANAIPSAAGAAGSSRADAGAPPVASFAGASGALVAAGTSAAALMV